MNIYEKILEVTNSIKNVEKNLTVGEGKYQYKAVSDADVISAVRKAEYENKLLSMVIKQDLLNESQTEVSDKYGNVKLYHGHTVKLTTRIIDVEQPTDYIDVESLAFGWDNGDKGTGKASTYGRKYALLNAYKIITGEDPDQNASEDLKKTKSVGTNINDSGLGFSPEQRKELLSKIEIKAEENDKVQAICKYCGISKISDMSDKHIAEYKQIYKL